jgi:hypothetical protein
MLKAWVLFIIPAYGRKTCLLIKCGGRNHGPARREGVQGEYDFSVPPPPPKCMEQLYI